MGPFRPLSERERRASLEATIDGVPAAAAVWVFAYGSLLWRPCFEPARACLATAPGYRRRFSVWTVRARGTPGCPGLGLALEPGQTGCTGFALAVAPAGRRAALEALWAREMLTGVYRPCWLDLDTAGGALRAIAFVAAPGHPQHAGDLPLDAQAAHIARARGRLGSCRDYLERTVEALERHSIRDEELVDLRRRVAAYRAASA